MKKLFTFMLASAMTMSLVLPAVARAEESKTAESKSESSSESGSEEKAPVAPGEEGAAGFDEVPVEEFDIKDAEGNDTLHVGVVYFQPVDMEPAGTSLAKEDSDCHMETDISALQGNLLGFSDGAFVPYLQVKLFIKSQRTGEEEEVAFMPMNASDGPHYGANVKFKDGVGLYDLRFEIKAPGNEYLLHVDKETGVAGKFWTEPLVVEVKDFEWDGRQW